MNENCKKYKELFVFAEEYVFLEHIQNCPECKKEHEKQQTISALVKKAAPQIKKNKPSLKISKIAAVLLFILIPSLLYCNIPKKDYNIAYMEETSIIAQMGLPTDDYGLLTVGE